MLDKMIVLEETIVGDDDGGQDLGGDIEEDGPIRDLELDREVSEPLKQHSERSRRVKCATLRDAPRHLHACDWSELEEAKGEAR